MSMEWGEDRSLVFGQSTRLETNQARDPVTSQRGVLEPWYQ